MFFSNCFMKLCAVLRFFGKNNVRNILFRFYIAV